MSDSTLLNELFADLHADPEIVIALAYLAADRPS